MDKWEIKWQRDFACPKCGTRCNGEDCTMSLDNDRCALFCCNCLFILIVPKKTTMNIESSILSTETAMDVLGLRPVLC